MSDMAGAATGGSQDMDIVWLLASVAFFVVSNAIVGVCARLQSED